jgi:signal transduction histidine kinase
MLPKPLKILLIDDDEDDCVLTQSLLAEIDHLEIELEWESRYETALSLIAAKAYHAYLVDYRLGKHTGVELLQRIVELGIKAPVIMLTGLGSETIAVEAMRAGAADYIPKSAVSRPALERILSTSVEKYLLRLVIDEKHRALATSNQELLHRNDEIQHFYHTVSHELKTPLTAMREFVSIVLEGLTGPLNEQQREYLQIAKDSCDQMTFHLNDLLDATRLDIGKLRITPRQTSIESVLNQAIASMALSATQGGIRLQQELQTDLREVFIDERRINQVIINLIGNALKFTSKGGRITVKVDDDSRHPGHIRVSVHDTGCGIESDNLERIFDRLYQVPDDRGQCADGLGLGLYISREIVRLHGGELSVESTPGVGSVFSFYFGVEPRLSG